MAFFLNCLNLFWLYCFANIIFISRKVSKYSAVNVSKPQCFSRELVHFSVLIFMSSKGISNQIYKMTNTLQWKTKWMKSVRKENIDTKIGKPQIPLNPWKIHIILKFLILRISKGPKYKVIRKLMIFIHKEVSLQKTRFTIHNVLSLF